MKIFWTIMVTFSGEKTYKKLFKKIEESFEKSCFLDRYIFSATKEGAFEKAEIYTRNNKKSIEWDALGYRAYYDKFEYTIDKATIKVMQIPEPTFSYNHLKEYLSASDFLAYCKQENKRE